VKSQWVGPLLVYCWGEKVSIYTGRQRGNARLWQFVITEINKSEDKDYRCSFGIYKEEGEKFVIAISSVSCNNKQLSSVQDKILGTRIGDITRKDIDEALMEGLL
jgi:hypothetical protein